MSIESKLARPDRWADVGRVPRTSFRARLARASVRRAAGRLPFRVTIPGERIGGGTASGVNEVPVMRLQRPESFYRRLGAGGLIGFGEAFQAGDWDCDELAGLLTVFVAGIDTFVPTPLQWIRGHRAAPRHPRDDEETISGARRNARHHYDLPSALFRGFLDETMTYSAAMFLTDDDGLPIAPEDALADAQRRKIDRMLDLVGVAEGTRLLEIGTGWGELAIRAARRGALVHTVTNSAEQAMLARDRVADAGLADRVHVDLRDYRELAADSGGYDAIVSVEMIEAVGQHHWPAYFTTLDRLLAPHGRVGLQAITMRHDRMMKVRHTYTWIHKYIFPGGLIPSIPVIEQALASQTGLHVLDRHAFGSHYAATLRLWRARFTRNWPSIEQLGFDATFRRTWEFYLAYCEAGFAAEFLDVYQLVLSR